jgi:hypothetical protein
VLLNLHAAMPGTGSGRWFTLPTAKFGFDIPRTACAAGCMCTVALSKSLMLLSHLLGTLRAVTISLADTSV